jgi:hypothetical protein
VLDHSWTGVIGFRQEGRDHHKEADSQTKWTILSEPESPCHLMTVQGNFEIVHPIPREVSKKKIESDRAHWTTEDPKEIEK